MQFLFNCTSCGGELTLNYETNSASKLLTHDMGAGMTPSILRYRSLLPMHDLTKIVTLNEGGTPLVSLQALGKRLGLLSVYGKDETRNPTHSFKDRAISVGVSVMKEIGVMDAYCVSGGGNTGTSVAAYCARAGIRSHIYVPSGTSRTKILNVLAFGANLRIITGTSLDALNVAKSEMGKGGHFPLMTRPQMNPYTLEGCKTMVFEIIEQMHFDVPDLIVLGVGTGTNLSATWKGLVELYRCAMIKRFPRLVAVQSETCMPLVDAFNRGLRAEEVRPWPNAHTIASGLNDSFPDAHVTAMRALKESKGTAVSVTDDEIMAAQITLARDEGIFAEPAGAASIAGAIKMANSGSIQSSEKVVCGITGSGLKQVEALDGILTVPIASGH